MEAVQKQCVGNGRMKYLIFTFMYSLMAIAHAVAGIAFSIDGNTVGSVAQLIGAAFWALLAMHTEKLYN